MKTIVPYKIEIPKELLKIVEERLDVETQPTINKITWTDQKNTEHELTKLTDNHLINLSYWLERKHLTRTRKIIRGELEKRATGSYPNDFEENIKNYKTNPEIWRLKIY